MELAHDIRGSGLHIPKDIALVTIGNWPHIRFSEVPLTAIDYDHKQIAKKTVECLLSRIDNQAAPIQNYNFEPFIVFRSSSLLGK
jgi:DNA-binding LacI/PurR family transcriptional regulator